MAEWKVTTAETPKNCRRGWRARRAALTLLFLIAAAPAWAEWVKVYFDDEVSTYMDPASMRIDGNLRRVWQVEDEKRNVHDGVMSRRGLWEYDCAENRFRLLQGSDHSGQMARGKVISSVGTPSNWFAAPPGTYAENVLRIICAQ